MDWKACLIDPEGAKIATLDCIGPLLQNIIGALLNLAGVVALFFIILSGYKYMTSGGDPKQLEGARHTLTYAIIGLVVVLLSAFIINSIADLTGVPCIKMFGFTNCSGVEVTPGGSGGPNFNNSFSEI